MSYQRVMDSRGAILTLKEAAGYLEISEWRLRSELSLGRLPGAYRTTPAKEAPWRIPIATLNAYRDELTRYQAREKLPYPVEADPLPDSEMARINVARVAPERHIPEMYRRPHR